MDDIRRKLALIDREFAERGLGRRIDSAAGACPLVFPAVGLIVGVITEHLLNVSVVLWLILLALGVAATIAIYCARGHSRLERHSLLLLCLCVSLCTACLGGIRLESFRHAAPNDIRNLVGNEQKPATIRGIIITEPYTNYNPDWEFARFKFTDPSSSFYLRLTEVETTTGWASAVGVVRVQVDQPVPDLSAGDYIQAYCLLGRFGPPTNAGQFDTARYLSQKNVFVAASIKSRDGIELLPSPPAAFPTRARSKIRTMAAHALLGNLPPERQSRALLEALLLGRRRDIDSDTYLAFRRTGLLHFISLSGMHMGILIATVWWFAKVIGLLKHGRSVICIIAIGVFLLIAPARAPTVRAAIIGWVLCASFLFRRRSNSINALSLAAIILLLIRPTQLFEAGWQLSFTTVLGILLFADKIDRFLRELTGNRLVVDGLQAVSSVPGMLKQLGGRLLTLFSVGYAAWAGGAGILLYHFYTVTPLAGIWTMLALPLVGAILALGFLKMVLFYPLPTVGTGLGIIISWLSDLFVWVVKLFSHVGISEIVIGHVPAPLVISYYCFILFAGFAYFGRPLLKKAVVATMLVFIVACFGLARGRHTGRDDLLMTALDTGHGQAIVVGLPGGAHLLFDCGSLHRSDIGRRTIRPFLRYAGIEEIDAVLISHNDIDHVNGIPEVLESGSVGAVYANEAFFREKEEWTTAKYLNDILGERGVTIRPLEGNLEMGGPARMRILWPDKRVPAGDLTENDRSLVSLIEFGSRRILLCSDIEGFAQRELVRLYPALKADVVVVPHHGSPTTTEPGFLRSLGAEVLIYSCDLTQYERVLRSEQAGTANKFCTSKDGAVTVRISAAGKMQIETFRKEKK
ncbi:MAG: ComEC/Rec2 family competence protein [Phycisphaerales bacterium]|nr:MAG: ComEC/Rec2 family competence protein [Phycisphaerales bacterium]